MERTKARIVNMKDTRRGIMIHQMCYQFTNTKDETYAAVYPHVRSICPGSVSVYGKGQSIDTLQQLTRDETASFIRFLRTRGWARRTVWPVELQHGHPLNTKVDS